MIRTMVVLALVAAAAGAEVAEVTAPVFRGVMGMGKRALVLFELPGQSGNWQGEVGAVIPGTNWKIRSAALNPGQVVIDVPGKGSIALAQGQTYRGGKTAVKAEDVARPQNAPPAEFIPPTAAQRAETERRRQAAMQAAIAAAKAKGAAAEPEVEEIVEGNGRVTSIDVAKYDPPIDGMGMAGFETVFMVTSPACGACRAIRPSIEAHGKKPHKRVVFLDIGTTTDGKINWYAPLVRNRRIDSLPHFFVHDQSGKLVSGDDAVQKMKTW